MSCQNLFSGQNKNIVLMSSAENLTQRAKYCIKYGMYDKIIVEIC